MLARQVGLAAERDGLVRGRRRRAVLATLAGLGVDHRRRRSTTAAGCPAHNRLAAGTLLDVLRLAARAEHPELRRGAHRAAGRRLHRVAGSTASTTGAPAGRGAACAPRPAPSPGSAGWPAWSTDRDGDRDGVRRGRRPGRSRPNTLDAARPLDRVAAAPRRPAAAAPAPPWARPARVAPMTSTWSTGTSRSALGARLAGDGPDGRPRPRRGRGGRRAARRRRPLDRAGPRLHRPGRRRAHRAGPRRRPAAAGCRPTPTASPRIARARSSTSCTEKKGPPPGLSLAIGSRVTGAEVGAAARASSARKVLGQFDPFHDRRRAGRLLLVAPNIVARRARARASTRTTSGSGSACTRRPTGCSSPPCRGCATTCCAEMQRARRRPSSPTRRDAADDVVKRRRRGRPRRRRAAACSTCLGTPEQKEILDRVTGVMSLLEGHADVVMDGVGPDGDPDASRGSARSSTSAARASAPSTGCCAGCSASTPRWRSTATAPRSSAPSSTRSAWTTSTPSGPSPANLPQQGRDRRPGRLGRPRPRLRLRWRCTPPSPPSGSRVRRGARRAAGRGAGRWSPAPAAPTRWPCSRPPSSRAASAAGASSASTVDHGLQDGSAEHAAARGRADGRARRRRDGDRPRHGRRRRAWARGGRPGGAVRRARRRSPHALRRAPSCCSGTPATTRPRPCCSGWPAARAAARWPGCAARFDVVPPAAARRHAATTP